MGRSWEQTSIKNRSRINAKKRYEKMMPNGPKVKQNGPQNGPKSGYSMLKKRKKGTIKIATKKCLQRFINTSIYKLTMINLIPKKNKTILAK